MVRNDLLVAPALIAENVRQTRKLYLPYPDGWYPMNLRPDDSLGEALPSIVRGGQHIEYDCRISDQESQLPYITPMYIREGLFLQAIPYTTLSADTIRRHHSKGSGTGICS